MPAPLMVNPIAASAVIVNGCVSDAVNVIAAIVVLADAKRELTLDKLLNVAVSPAPVPG